jgi:acyl phosphate:glycerol-3-phosphate acyltransferase
MTDVLVVLGGYLLGSMPFGYWLVRAVRGEDVRERGSGNIGATNVWRVYGRRYGIPVMLLDIAKGFVPALAGVLVSGDLLGVLTGAAAMAGHWRPLFLGFSKGGKTVATAGGVFWAVAPLVAVAGALIWCALFVVFRYSSVASMGAAGALPLVALALGEPWPVIVFAASAAGVVLLLHRGNIRRLRAGTESRFHFRRTARA